MNKDLANTLIGNLDEIILEELQNILEKVRQSDIDSAAFNISLFFGFEELSVILLETCLSFFSGKVSKKDLQEVTDALLTAYSKDVKSGIKKDADNG